MYKKTYKHKRVISKPILIYMQPKYYSKATIDFNYFLPNNTYFTNQLINYTAHAHDFIIIFLLLGLLQHLHKII